MAISDETRVISLWPDGTPGIDDESGDEQESFLPPDKVKVVRNVTRPTLTVYLPKVAANTHTAVIVCPGGAFHFLAIEHEGTDVASWLVDRGVAALVLRYRVVRTSSNDEEFQKQFRETMSDWESARALLSQASGLAIADGKQAVRVARRLAPDWGIDSNRIGLLGFSAGGAVASGVALKNDAESRPDFVAPIYGAPWEDVAVPADATPMFLALASDDDMAVRSSLPLYSKWRDAGHSAELHVFSRGGHGFGMRKQGLPSDRWIELFGDWLGGLGFMGPPHSST